MSFFIVISKISWNTLARRIILFQFVSLIPSSTQLKREKEEEKYINKYIDLYIILLHRNNRIKCFINLCCDQVLIFLVKSFYLLNQLEIMKKKKTKYTNKSIQNEHNKI